MISILHKDFKYTPAAKTNIRLTIRREQKRLADLAAKKVVSISAIEVTE